MQGKNKQNRRRILNQKATARSTTNVLCKRKDDLAQWHIMYVSEPPCLCNHGVPSSFQVWVEQIAYRADTAPCGD
jgi:hypothetical protein